MFQKMATVLETTFLTSCEVGNLAVVTSICQQHVDINCQDAHGITGLMWSVINSRHAVFKYLMQHPEIDINLRSAVGLTALQYAIHQVLKLF